jgi:serine/threonine-protein kinase
MRVLDYGRDADGLCYIAMELLDGQSLFALLREARGPLPDRRTVDLLRQVLAALAVAHEMGVVHRDLKPENIIVLQSKSDDGNVSETVKVCDFGMAKVLTDEGARDASLEKLTSQGVIVGTPEYMSPEQGKGEELDIRSDLYSVGVILYQMLTGRLPFQADTPIATVLKHLVEEPKSPSQLIAGVNLGLEAICLRALKKEREDRFASAREMRTALRNAATLGARAADPAMPPSPGSPLDSSRDAFAATNARIMATSPVRRRTAADVLASGAEPRRAPTILVFAALAVCVATIGGFVVHRLKDATATVAEPLTRPMGPPVLPANAPRGEPVASTPRSGASSTEPSPFVPPSAVARTPAVVSNSKAVLKSASAVEVPPASAPSGVSSAPIVTPARAMASPPWPENGASEPLPLATALAPRPPPDPFDKAIVSFGAVKTSHAQSSDVLMALPSARFNQCYRDGLRAHGSALRGSGTLHVHFGGEGHVSEATFVGPPDLAVIGQCVADSAIGSEVRNVESGAMGADVDLSFEPD